MEKIISDDKTWSECSSLNDYRDYLVFEEMLEDAVNEIARITDGDDEKELILLIHATVQQAAFLHADVDPKLWVPKLKEAIDDIALKYKAK